MRHRFASVPRAVDAVAAGGIVIVLDDEERENEGDLFTAVQTVTPEKVYFMLSRACGQLCVPVAPEIAARLRLEPIVSTEDLGPAAFAVPIDHRECRTGISPEERVRTMQAIVDPASRGEDFVRPGHVFPLIARPGGLRQRQGHTEAAVDLARMAGLAPAGVLCEVCSRDGRTMAGQAELLALAEQFELPVLAIRDLIRWGENRNGRAATLAVAEGSG